MLNAIKTFFDTRLDVADEDKQQGLVPAVDLASAALLIEVMKSDHDLDDRESEEFISVLKETLNIDDTDLNELKGLAEEEAEQATSLYEFTKLINDHYNYAQKCALIENMWRIAFSDDKLDKYEDHLIRKIAELIYVTHSDFIKTKLKVRDSKT